MTWFKVDDTLAMHPKILAAGNAAVGLWVRLGSYSSAQNLDGFVPEIIAKSCGTKSEIRALLEAKMLVVSDGGYTLHDFLKYNPSREKVLADRDASAERKRKSRDKSQGESRVTKAVTERVTATLGHSPVTAPRPDPTRPELIQPLALVVSTAEAKAAKPRPRDLIWDALSAEFGEPATKTEKTNRGRQARELREAGATPEDIAARIAEHRRRGEKWNLTANALMSNWTSLGTTTAPKRNPGDTGWNADDAVDLFNTPEWIGQQ